jgi:uncharacterized Zn-binding protein involved in type VI secretion
VDYIPAEVPTRLGSQENKAGILPPCCPTVLTGSMPQARVTDMATCVGPPDVIVLGSFTVLVGALPAARLGDMTAHGGTIVLGLPTVLIR